MFSQTKRKKAKEQNLRTKTTEKYCFRRINNRCQNIRAQLDEGKHCVLIRHV